MEYRTTGEKSLRNIAFFVGLLIAIPVTYLAYVYVYRLLMKEVAAQPVPAKFDLSFK